MGGSPPTGMPPKSVRGRRPAFIGSAVAVSPPTGDGAGALFGIGFVAVIPPYGDGAGALYGIGLATSLALGFITGGSVFTGGFVSGSGFADRAFVMSGRTGTPGTYCSLAILGLLPFYVEFALCGFTLFFQLINALKFITQ